MREKVLLIIERGHEKMKGKILKFSAILIALVFIGSGFTFAASVEASEEEWSKTFGGLEVGVAKSVQQTKDGGYIITGATKSYGAGEEDLWLIKVKGE